MADRIAAEIGFIVRDHPYLKVRVEDTKDLRTVDATDVSHGAFMGDVVLRLPGADFSTHDGWRGLVEWCIRLDAVLRALDSDGLPLDVRDPNSDDFISFSRSDTSLVVRDNSGSRRAEVDITVFRSSAREFLRSSMQWIRDNYPAAFENVNSAYIWERLNPYRNAIK